MIATNHIRENIFKNSSNNKLQRDFKKILIQITKEIENSNKTLSVLNKNFKFNFKIQDLKRFKKFKSIIVIGMGGSILGAEAIYNFLQKKIKKKIYFFDNLDEDKIEEFKKKEKNSKVLFLVISKSGNTIETLSNTFLLNIIKKNAKNVILIT